MVKIEDAVDGVLNAMRSRGCVEQSLKEIKWSILFNLFTKPLDIDSEGVITNIVASTVPDLLQELFPGQHLPTVIQKYKEQLVLQSGQIDLLAITHNSAFVGIHG